MIESAVDVELSKNYIASYPKEAADILLSLPVADTARFLQLLAPEETASICVHLLPQYSARIIVCLKPAYTKLVFAVLDPQTISNMLRQLTGKDQEHLLNYLQERKRSICHEKLKYEEQMVGRWMESLSFSIPASFSCQQALLAVTQSLALPLDPLYIIDNDLNLCGTAMLAELIAANGERGVTTIMSQPPPAIPSVESLATAILNSYWDAHDVMPVINKDHVVIGKLNYRQMMRALESTEQSGNKNSIETQLSSLLNVYSNLVLTFAKNIITTSKRGD